MPSSPHGRFLWDPQSLSVATLGITFPDIGLGMPFPFSTVSIFKKWFVFTSKCVCVLTHECRCPQRPEGSVSGSWGWQDCESLDAGAGNQTQVLARTVSAPNSRALSLSPGTLIKQADTRGGAVRRGWLRGSETCCPARPREKEPSSPTQL